MPSTMAPQRSGRTVPASGCTPYLQRRPAERNSLIGPAIQEVDARLVGATPGLESEARAWDDAGSEV